MIRNAEQHFIAASSLDVSLGLHESAHDAEGAEEGPVVGPGGQAGNDGVVGPLPRRQDVRVALRQRKVGASVRGGIKVESQAFQNCPS